MKLPGNYAWLPEVAALPWRPPPMAVGSPICAEWQAWRNMNRRCHAPTDVGWPHYGGRGITVWEPWRKSFWMFYFWVGPKPTPRHTLDRINSNGHYVPENVRWATWKEQARNRRRPAHWRPIPARALSEAKGRRRAVA